MSSMPSLAQEGTRLNVIDGSVPNPLYLPKGCYFADRCKNCMQKCLEGQPKLTDLGNGHKVSCFLYEDEKGE